MDRFSLRDLLSVPGLLTLLRVPLAALFLFTTESPRAALAVLAAAALSDMLDGWSARKLGRATPTGAIVDPIVDKIFVATVAFALVFHGRLSLPLALCLGARDVLELPLVVTSIVDRRSYAHEAEGVKANVLGKGVTVLQFVAVLAALLRSELVLPLGLVTGALGVVAALSYFRRASKHRPAANES